MTERGLFPHAAVWRRCALPLPGHRSTERLLEMGPKSWLLGRRVLLEQSPFSCGFEGRQSPDPIQDRATT